MPSHSHYGRNNTPFPFASLRLCVRPALLFTLLLMTSLAACTSGPPSRKSKPIVLIKESVAHKAQDTAQLAVPENLPEETPKAPEKKGGTFTLLKPLKFEGAKGGSDAVETRPFSRERMVSVAVNEMPLPDFIHYIFSEILDVNYVMDSQLAAKKDKITLNLPNQVNEDQIFEITGEVLSKHGVAIYEKQGVFYVWAGTQEAGYSLGIGASFGDIPNTSGLIQQIIPIRYADAYNLRLIIPPAGSTKVMPSPMENALVVTGPREGVEQIIRFVNMLDRPSMRGRFVGMLKIKYWDLKEFVEKISEPLIREGIPVAKSSPHNGLFFIPIESSGGLIFFSAEKEWLERVKYWAGILDVPPLEDKKDYFLYYPQNSRASDLSGSLRSILGLGRSEGSRESTIPEKTLQIKEGGKAGAEKETKQSGDTGKGMIVLEDDIRMAVDPNRNALIIYATPGKFREIERLLQKLDVIPEQVLLEATVAEVTLTGSFELGVEWAFRNYTPADTGETGIFDLLAGGNGLSWAMLTKGAKFDLALEALAQDSLITVLSSPHLTVRDGKNANIVVGKDVPTITQSATSDIQVEGTSAIINSVQYRSTGVNLSVTPTIHARGVVTLEINQSVTKAEKTTTSDINSPTILNRSVTTEVVVGDGQTVVLGGLISDDGAEGESGVPFLKDIPLLGYFFRSETRSSDRTELIIMITPRIIRNVWQVDKMRDAIFEGLELLGREEGKKFGKVGNRKP